jgi:glycosyltransferase involved in cell wall biosynthesis
MKVGIGALATSKYAGVRQSGVHRYAIKLIEHLPCALPDDQLIVYAGNTPIDQQIGAVTVRKARVPIEHPAARIAWEHLVLPLQVRQDRIDLYHGLAFASPMGIGVPSIVTIHDLAFLQWPEQVPGRRSQYLSRIVRGSVKRAQRVIAVSGHTKRDIVELLGVPDDRIDVTPLGVDATMQRPGADAIEAFNQEQGLENPFVLAVGNLEPRKNLATLVQAFASVAGRIPHDLVLVGAEGWRTEALHQALGNPSLRGRVRLQGFVPPDELPLWYSACDIFTIPSLYEGFGLPLLEAMACGAPAIASNRSSLPEVAGDAALLVDPDVESISAAIEHLATDHELRSLLSDKATARAAHFTWRRTAELTAECYRKALA